MNKVPCLELRNTACNKQRNYYIHIYRVYSERVHHAYSMKFCQKTRDDTCICSYCFRSLRKEHLGFHCKSDELHSWQLSILSSPSLLLCFHRLQFSYLLLNNHFSVDLFSYNLQIRDLLSHESSGLILMSQVERTNWQ